ncbi:adenine phosphoribosyltransferase [archaeon]|nr:adenine phosphoribosyltransferase [archaeon]
MDLKTKIRTVPNFPKEGIMFRDVTTLLTDPCALDYAIEQMAKQYIDVVIDKIVGIEARGFIFGALLAKKMDVGFVPIRKKGKLPAETISETYDLEYGTDTVEIHKDALKQGDKVVVADDLVATGGTLLASIKLLEKVGANIVGVSCVIDLPDLGGSKKLEKYKPHFLMSFEGE